jgi:hypothetical protein
LGGVTHGWGLNYRKNKYNKIGVNVNVIFY